MMADLQTSVRGCRGRGFDKEVADWMPRILELQRQGYIPAASIANRLNELGEKTRSGNGWSHTKVRRMLIIAEGLGYPVIRWTRSEAGMRRELHARSLAYIDFVVSRSAARIAAVTESEPQGSTLARMLRGKLS